MTTIRIQRILCPVDGSEPSVQAGMQAVAVARWSGARVTALHVSTPIRAASPEVLPLAVESRNDDTAQAARSWMDAQFRAASAAGVPMDFLVKTGVPAREILACASDIQADLIVMGTHGLSGFEHLVLGSVTEKVLRRAPCPVLTVPPHAPAVPRPFERVLCALDFSECSLAALEFAVTAALGSGAALTLAHVLEWPWQEPPPPKFDELPPHEAVALAAYRRRRERDALARLESLAPEALRDRCHLRVCHGRSYVEILRLATEEHADLIVLGVHGRNALDMAVFGSTTNQVVRQAACPVLTLRR